MTNVIPLRRKLSCVICQRNYVAVPRPTDHPLLVERRAHVCPDCRVDPAELSVNTEDLMDGYLYDVERAIYGNKRAKQHLEFLKALQNLGLGDDGPGAPVPA